MAVMLTDNLADGTQFFAYGKVWTDLPYNFTCFFADDSHNVCFTSIPDDVVRMEPFIALIIPFIWPQYAHGVDVHPVTHFTTLCEMYVRIAEQYIFGSFGEAQFVKVFVYTPFPYNVAFPVYFDDGIIQQTFVGNPFVIYIAVAQNQSVAAVGFAFHTWYIVTNRIAFTLIVMMLTSHPAWFMSFIFNVVFVIKFPYHITVPV